MSKRRGEGLWLRRLRLESEGGWAVQRSVLYRDNCAPYSIHTLGQKIKPSSVDLGRFKYKALKFASCSVLNPVADGHVAASLGLGELLALTWLNEAGTHSKILIRNQGTKVS